MSLRRDLERAAREREDPAARERSLHVVRAAYEQLEPRPRRARWPWRALLATALLGAIGAAGVAAASAPRSDVGRFVRHVLGVGEPRARPALVRVPGGGRLLVAAGDDAWIVASDGAKRRLGAYTGASWSPRGRFAAVWRGRELTAVDPLGRVRWSLPSPAAVADARWAPGDGFFVAYRTGGELRVVGGDGVGDRRVGSALAGVAPAWRRDGTHTLAFADARGRVTVVDMDAGGARRWRGEPLAGVRELLWAAGGEHLLAVSAGRLTLYGAGGALLASRALPAGMRAEHAAWAPRGSRVALVRTAVRTARSELVLLDAAHGLRARPLFSRLGRFGAPAWSPNGRWLLLPWADADQWLFLRPEGTLRRTAVANIARQFAPGSERGAFPRSVRWCCP